MTMNDLTIAEEREIYDYARTLTGRVRKQPNGEYLWSWGCRWKGQHYHVTARYTEQHKLIDYKIERSETP